MRLHWLAGLFIASLVLPASAGVVPGNVPARWNEGAADCSRYRGPPLEVQAYNPRTIILREGLCSTFEAPFLYLLIGSERALLIDTGDVADAKAMPLAATVMRLVPAGLPLLVAHTHRHMDHRAGDAQFARLAGVTVVPYDIDGVKRFFHFDHWPDGTAELDLGSSRLVEVIPTPGHNETHLVFYDTETAILFSGDFMMPARLLVDDERAEILSAARVADFVRGKPVSHVFGGHIEEDENGNLFDWESTWHPHEHGLSMTKADLLALPGAAAKFNGVYGRIGKFTFLDSMHELELMAAGIVLVLVLIAFAIIRYVRRRRRKRAA